jgi:AraC family transcriptional regulator, transcriptional activator of pobA
MVRRHVIPTLKNDSFRKSYLKNDSPAPLSKALSSDRYFEINHRCAWPTVMEAHRLNFYMIFISTLGEGIHTLGPREYYISENMLCFISPDMIRSWQAERDEQRGFFVTFSESFFNEGCENKRFLHELPFFQLDGNPLLILNSTQAQGYLSLFRQMQHEYLHGNEYSIDVLRLQLQLLLQKAHAQVKSEGIINAPENHSALRLVKAFKTLYLRDFHALGRGKGLMLKKVAEYAQELNVSQNHLNDTVKFVTGRSAGQLIRHQLTTHATMCLMHADKNISEIAFALGFEDPSYFARFYKSQTGKSPTEFRSTLNL